MNGWEENGQSEPRDRPNLTMRNSGNSSNPWLMTSWRSTCTTGVPRLTLDVAFAGGVPTKVGS